MQISLFRLYALSLLGLLCNASPAFAAPEITLLPTARTVVNAGVGFSLNVVATGNAPLFYQWYHDNRAITGATDSSYTDTQAAFGDRGAYTVKVTDGSNEVTRATGFVLVQLPDTGVIEWGGATGGNVNPMPTELTQVVAIAAGHRYAVALKADGTLATWGANKEGETVVPAGLTEVVAIAAGAYHTVALKANGTVVAWGTSAHGETAVPAGLTRVVAISAGAHHTLALKDDGTVVAWGNDLLQQSAVPAGLTSVVSVAAGGFHSLALKADGSVAAWGDNALQQTAVPEGLTQVVAIAAGGHHSLALKADGRLATWGYNYYGQTTLPAGLIHVTAIAAGALNTVTLQTAGTVVAWASTRDGEPAAPAGLKQVSALASGDAHTLALTSKVVQTIDFTGPINTTFTPEPIALTATASSGLAVSFSVISGPATVAGNVLTLTGTGTVNVRASQAGTSVYGAQSADASFVVAHPTVTVSAWTYAGWLAQYFNSSELNDAAISAATADPDGDGVCNLLEYAFGKSPIDASLATAPVQSLQAGALTLTYIRRKDVADLTYTVGVSSDLKTWESGATYTDEIAVTALDVSRDQVTVRDKSTLPTEGGRFMRLSVTQDSP